MPSKTGAPAQLSQSSRKGKKAWRKNVDIGDVEERMESLRDEERILGGPVHSKTNDQLFSVDTTGDEQVRKRITKSSLKALKSYQILSQRSAVPAVTSRKKTAISHEEKMRMLKVGRRKKGLLDTSTVEAKANQVQDAYQMWGADGSLLEGSSSSRSVKAPSSLRPHVALSQSAVSLPHSGTSYNPSFEAHQELLQTAHEAESKRVDEEKKWNGIKERMMSIQDETEDGAAPGMKVDTPDEEVGDREGEIDGGTEIVKKPTRPKTKKQRRKAAALLAEKREKAAIAAHKKQLESITSKTLRSLKQTVQHLAIKKKSDLPLQAADNQKKKKFGKHIVPVPRIDVQLGEELSESLRGLQPEGSLFRDRFENMQQRALVEPRVRVMSRRNKLKVKDYEKHAWKRFT